MKTFGVIIPTYNEEGVVENFLQDIRKQTRKPDQLIVADAHSTDRTRNIAKELGAEVIDGGMPGPGRNRGAEYANTDILFFMDADVRLFDPEFFKKAFNEFVERELGCAAMELSPMSKRIDDRIGHWVYNKLLHKQVKSGKQLAAGSFIAATKKVHEQIEGFDEAVTLGEDTDYAVRAAKVAPFGILKSVQIPVSVRRLDRDGRWGTVARYLLAGAHMIFKGPVKHGKIKYEFGYDHMKENE